jgi:hypothetical protein
LGDEGAKPFEAPVMVAADILKHLAGFVRHLVERVAFKKWRSSVYH